MEVSLPVRAAPPASCPAAPIHHPSRFVRPPVGASPLPRRPPRFFPGRSVSVSSRNHKRVVSASTSDLQRHKSSLESLFCYDKSIPEEIIEKPVGLSLKAKEIGNNPMCVHCQAKGAVLCATCSGSGLYIDSILESQGIIVKVRCLGCGGAGNIMCSGCGGRGHL